eukprot:m.14158 g.14158  ORF g.14158 m.14158 type:complete len:473 (-) comp6152_c0_seq2:1742-3160(-)
MARRDGLASTGLILFLLVITGYLLVERQSCISSSSLAPNDKNTGITNAAMMQTIEGTRNQIHELQQILLQVKEASNHQQLKLQQQNQLVEDAVHKPAPIPVRHVEPAVHNEQLVPMDKPLPGLMSDSQPNVVAAVVVLACNRPTVDRCLQLLLKYRPSAEQFPIVVSQDCGHKPTAKVIQGFVEEYDNIIHIEQPDLSEPQVEPRFRGMGGYYKIARHYKWMLTQVFDKYKYDAVIIVEDDLDVAPDFFSYFSMGKALLQADPTLWCVSAWNDNGKSEHVVDPRKLYRSDFFGGLGWMMRRELWVNELGAKWPNRFWDDWMREHEQRRDRACIRPEISRTRTFGKVGVSNGQFYDQYLRYIKLNTEPVPWLDEDVSYLLKSHYDPGFKKAVYEQSTLVSVETALSGSATGNQLRVEYDYSNKRAFDQLATRLGIMKDLKDGVPRMAYMGVVTFHFKGKLVHIAPKQPFNGYD